MTVVETKNLERNHLKQTEERARSVSPLNNIKTFYPPDKKFPIKINNLKDQSKYSLFKLLFLQENLMMKNHK